MDHYNPTPPLNQQMSIADVLQGGGNSVASSSSKSKMTPGMSVKRSQGPGLMPMPQPKKPAYSKRSSIESFSESSDDSINIIASTSSQPKKFKFKNPASLSQALDYEVDVIEDEFASQDCIQTQEPQKITVTTPVIQTQEPQKFPVAVQDVTEAAHENKENRIGNTFGDSTLTALLYSLNNEAKLSDRRNEIYNKILEKLN